MLNNKATIAIATATVLLSIIAVTGTTVFIKNKGKTKTENFETVSRQDRDIEEQFSNIVESEKENENEEQVQENEEKIDNKQIEDTEIENNKNSKKIRKDSIRESEIERVETVKISEKQVSERHYIGWSPMEVTDSMASSQINVTNNNDIKITKKAITKSGENLVTNGEEITYSITIRNNGINDVQDLEVKDKIPENTTYVKESAVGEVEEVIEKEKIIGLKWRINLNAGEEKTVEFKVIVDFNAKGVIKNVALANGEKTGIVENSIIECVKTAKIEGKKAGENARVGDKITYTITVKNTGNIAGIANVQDIKLKDLINNKILEIDEKTQKIANRLIVGAKVYVPANDEESISFTAKLINVDGAIKNIAVVGESKSEVNIDTCGLVVEKELIKIERDKKEINTELPVKKGDILTYAIKVKNIGSTVINRAIITDELPPNLEALSPISFDNVKIEAGETVQKEVKVQVMSVDGPIENIARVEDIENPDNKSETKKIINTIDIDINKTAVLEKAVQNNREEYKNIAEIGDTIHYTISVTNRGSIKLEELKIVDETMNKENTITLDVGESNLEALKFDHQVVDTDIKVEEGKITYIYNTAAAIYTDKINSDNNITVKDTEKVKIRDKYDYTVNYLEKDTNIVLKQAKKVTGQIFGTVIQSSSQVDIIDKYRFDSADKETLTIGTQENVINLYYEINVEKITVKKVWQNEPDGVNIATIRPKTIELQLKTKENGKDIVKYRYLLNTATESSHEFEVEKCDKNGKTIIYTADESGDLKNYDKLINEFTITNVYKYTKLVPTKKAYKDAECTREVNINNDADNFKPGETVYYKLSVTNKGKALGNAVLTDDLPSYLENYAITQGNASLNSSKVIWKVTNLNIGETETIIVKGTVKQIVKYKDLSTKNGKESETTARLFVRKDGKIPYEGSNTPYSPQLYTACLGTVYLNTNKAIAYGDLSKSDIYDLINRNNNIVNIVQRGISFNDLKMALAKQGITLANDEVVIWYVNKKEDDGWHIDGAIRKASDLQKVTNTLKMVQIGNNETVMASADIKLLQISTNIVRNNFSISK